MKQLICIVCPKGCHLTVDEQEDYKVYGAACERGREYGKIELTNPRRTITSTVAITGAAHKRLPVKTSGTVPKGDMAKIINALKDIQVHSGVKVGQVILENVCDTGVDIVATRSL